MQRWPKALRSLLLSVSTGGPDRVAVLGIGNETAGDDAAGVAVARALSARLGVHKTNALVLDGGPAPENQTGPLRRFRPTLVLLVDAAQMDDPPGSVRLLDWEETLGLSASTHTLPPYLLAEYLVAELGCRVALLGIQPEQTDFGAPLSDTLAGAVESVANELAVMLHSGCSKQAH